MSLTEDSTAKFSETVGLEQVLATMKSAEIQIVALDACRDYPIPLTKGIGTKPKTGLARMRANGAVISYATKPDQVSWDGRDAGKNSYYTKHLKKLLLEPGLTIEQVFQKVRSAVVAETSQENLKQQWPIEENLLRGGEFYFIPPVEEENAPTMFPVP
ncbi:peptidase C14, caspase catalytic subunit p20 [Beggiatoa sp. PS]|nr:peptidase C14, caspase catalytic subunit p20 [Beggiatoa sp. PS]